MKKFILLCAALSVAGCAIKAKNHTLFCVGVCAHSELEIEKEKKRRETPASPAPDSDADKG